MSAPLLSVRDVRKRFAGLSAVEDFAMDLGPAEIVGLIGPNGAGKSTVLNLLSGFHRPECGSIRFAGHDVTGASPGEIARRGLVRTFQHIRLFGDLTVRQNVEVATQSWLPCSLAGSLLRTRRYRERLRVMRDAVDELLGDFELAHLQHHPAGALPYGDQRRVEIVRALATRPRALLLDEPAAGMNAPEALALAEFLAETSARHGIAILVVEHHFEVVRRLCRRVIVMDQGTVIATGAPREVTEDAAVIRAYLGAAA
ncbi:MAG: ABC transporter ATP-binding protein [Thermomicrobiales bacterium]